MFILTKPKKLIINKSKIAIITPSWGGAAKFLHRYKIGKQQLIKEFGFKIVEMPNSLKSEEYIYKNPQARAEDINEAFSRRDIDGIFTTIGGEDSIRVLPYLNKKIIKNNPKVFLGYSDITTLHLFLYSLGMVSFYGPSVMSSFAENGGIPSYLKKYFVKTVCNNSYPYEIKSNSNGYMINNFSWDDKNKQNTKINRLNPSKNTNKLLNGKGVREGNLIGGCVETLEGLKGTEFWPTKDKWQNAILFLETSEDTPNIDIFERYLRNYAIQGILKNLNGIILGRHIGSIKEQIAYENSLLRVAIDEFGLNDLIIISNMDFGHTRPIFTIPYGIKARLNAKNRSLEILENAVV